MLGNSCNQRWITEARESKGQLLSATRGRGTQWNLTCVRSSESSVSKVHLLNVSLSGTFPPPSSPTCMPCGGTGLTAALARDWGPVEPRRSDPAADDVPQRWSQGRGPAPPARWLLSGMWVAASEPLVTSTSEGRKRKDGPPAQDTWRWRVLILSFPGLVWGVNLIVSVLILVSSVTILMENT